MGKLLFFAIIIVLFYWMLRDKFPTKSKEEKDEETALLTDATEELVCCEHCGVHVQEDQSVAIDGKFFCSDEHYQQYLDLQP
ncbi:MAG: PP0621 family protein [Nitrosomonas sp.]|nr:PP0621 family protein [Nitrosomonas sp.]